MPNGRCAGMIAESIQGKNIAPVEVIFECGGKTLLYA